MWTLAIFSSDLDNGIIKIEFNKSAENDSDIFMKNVNQEVYERHTMKFLEECSGGVQ